MPPEKSRSPSAMVFDVKPFAVHDGDGIRTTIFFKGCPLRCLWCHNPEGVAPGPSLAFYAHKCTGCGLCIEACARKARAYGGGQINLDRDRCARCGACAKACPFGASRLFGKPATLEEAAEKLFADREFFAASNGGITLSGGECLLQAGFCRELLRLAAKDGIHACIDTCGHVPWESFEAVLPFMPKFLYDIKAIDPMLHRRLTGKDNSLILRNFERLVRLGAEIEVRVPLVCGANEGEMAKIAEKTARTKGVSDVRILPYHPFAEYKCGALSEMPFVRFREPDAEILAKTKEIFRSFGLDVKD